tara:strand:+ start:324 stop:854 length:531 start_codon:yes stop_codon:yes gene_type:complete
MSQVYIIDNLISKRHINNLYKGLINTPNWNISRCSIEQDKGTFPGLDIFSDNKSHNSFWHGYFISLYEKLNEKFYEQNKFYLPPIIKRIALGAKNNNSFTDFHIDEHNQSNGWTIVGFLTPEWEKDWGGALQVEDKTIDFVPGRFVIFKVNTIHNGFGSKKDVPYWRISVNYNITD